MAQREETSRESYNTGLKLSLSFDSTANTLSDGFPHKAKFVGKFNKGYMYS